MQYTLSQYLSIKTIWLLDAVEVLSITLDLEIDHEGQLIFAQHLVSEGTPHRDEQNKKVIQISRIILGLFSSHTNLHTNSAHSNRQSVSKSLQKPFVIFQHNKC